MTGGQVVTVTGSGFAAGMSVTLGGTTVVPAGITFGSFTFTTPPGAEGYAQVQVTRDWAQRAHLGRRIHLRGPEQLRAGEAFRILDTRPGSRISMVY